MDLLRKYFPYSFGVETLKELIVTIIAYILTGLLIGLLLGFLSHISVVGFVFLLLIYLLDLYCGIGSIFAIVRFVKVLN